MPMKRCSRCILPESFPGITFDENGVCNYCLAFVRIPFKEKRDELEKILSEYRGRGSRADCVVTYSGGRDSSYVLYKMVKIHGMRTVVVTYDWGMMTSEAKRNWARMKERLNVEHIVIKTDTEKIYKHIKQNIKAWLKKPHLGMVPIFTHADKKAHYHINKIAKKYGIPLVIRGTGNPYETTIFKTAYFGVNEIPPGGTTINISKRGRIKLLLRYLMEYVRNPGYINGSIVEMTKAFFLHYVTSFSGDVRYLDYYHYMLWDEDEIISTIRKELDWESPADTILTWRIDDCTAPFYNYLHYAMAGFTENDTFRSNQVRAGVLSRGDALRLAEEENLPRMRALERYLERFGFTFNDLRNLPRLCK